MAVVIVEGEGKTLVTRELTTTKRLKPTTTTTETTVLTTVVSTVTTTNKTVTETKSTTETVTAEAPKQDD